MEGGEGRCECGGVAVVVEVMEVVGSTVEVEGEVQSNHPYKSVTTNTTTTTGNPARRMIPRGGKPPTRISH